MNYLMALVFVILYAVVAKSVSDEVRAINLGISPGKSYLILLGFLIALITAEFVLIANGFARLMEL